MSEQFTTVKISQYASKQLSLISDFSGKPKGQIIEKFILELFHSFYGQVNESVNSGAYVDFDYSIKAFPKADLVSGQYAVDINTPREVTDEINFNLATDAFKALDNRYELNKAKFKKSLEMLSSHD